MCIQIISIKDKRTNKEIDNQFVNKNLNFHYCVFDREYKPIRVEFEDETFFYDEDVLDVTAINNSTIQIETENKIYAIQDLDKKRWEGRRNHYCFYTIIRKDIDTFICNKRNVDDSEIKNAIKFDTEEEAEEYLNNNYKEDINNLEVTKVECEIKMTVKPMKRKFFFMDDESKRIR